MNSYNREKICGIYLITNRTNDKKYIGKSVDIFRRWNSHFELGGNGFRKGGAKHLYFSMRKYGRDQFTFRVIKECEKSELDHYERECITKCAEKYG